MIRLIEFCILWRQPLRCFTRPLLSRASRARRPIALVLLQAGAVLGMVPLPPPVPG